MEYFDYCWKCINYLLQKSKQDHSSFLEETNERTAEWEVAVEQNQK